MRRATRPARAMVAAQFGLLLLLVLCLGHLPHTAGGDAVASAVACNVTLESAAWPTPGPIGRARLIGRSLVDPKTPAVLPSLAPPSTTHPSRSRPTFASRLVYRPYGIRTALVAWT